MTAKSALVKLPKTNNDHLNAFLLTVGVAKTINLYKYSDNPPEYANLTYINVEPILPILSVPVDWLRRNTRDPRYYIEVGRRVYVSKYGITKLIAESREEISFKLQDYLFELLYTAETQPNMNAVDLKSRTELLECIEKITSSLTEYKAETSEEIADLRCTFGEMEDENKRLTILCEQQSVQIEGLEGELSDMRKIASTLAKFARNKSKIIPKIASSESLDVSDESDEDLDRVALEGKNAYRIATRRVTIKAERKDRKCTMVLLRSADHIDQQYTWQLTDKVDEQFKLESLKYLDTDENPPGLMVWFADLELNDWSKKIIEIFIELNTQCREDIMSRIIERC